MIKKEIIQQSLLNLYTFANVEKAQSILDNMYEANNVDSADRLSVAQIKSMKFDEFIGSQVNAMLTKANESMSTGQATFGGNFVNGEILIDTILNSVRDADTLLSYVQNQITMTNPIQALPVEWADVEMKSFAENADVPWTPADLQKAGTQKLVLTAKTFGVTVYFSRELLEDSVVNIMSYVERKILQGFVTTVHKGIINGDTDNAINGTTAANSVLRQIDGLRKIALDGSNIIEAWELDLQDIRSARALLGIKGINPANLILILDHLSYNKMLGLTQVESMEKFGNSATVVNGRIATIDGIRVISREEVPLTQADGVVSNTANLNVAGTIVLAHVPSLYIGWRRPLDVEQDYDTTTQQHFVTGSTRFDFQVNENDAPAVAVITNTVVDS